MSTETGRRLGLLRVALDQAGATVINEVGPAHPELRPAHLQIFRFDGIDGASTAELAAHAGMTKQSMHELVTHLQQHGYVTRERDPDDSRALRLRLTPAGRTLERDVHLAIGRVLEAWRAKLGRDRFDALWDSLRELTGEDRPPPDLAEIRARRRR
jgi:DNA-binding MarR family transcriptional regulator